MGPDESQKTEIALQRGVIVEKRLFASAAQKTIDFVEAFPQRPVRTDDFNHRLHVAFHPIDDATEFFAHRNPLTLRLIAAHFCKNRLVRLVQVCVDTAKREADFVERQTDYGDIFILKRTGKLLGQRIERLHVAPNHLRRRWVGIVV